MPSRFRFLACCVAGCLATSLALANDPASQQLRDQQQTLRQMEQQLRLERWQHGRARPQDDLPHAQAAVNRPCWQVTGIRLAGNQRLSTQALAPTVRAHLQPCMGVIEINQLLKAITGHYVQTGYPTSRPYLQRQPQAGATLDIVIVEGFVESIELDADLPLSLQTAFPGLVGQPLYLPDLEQGLDQLNRLRAYQLSADLLPGERQGATRVVLQARQFAPRWHLESRFDNRGNVLTGRHRGHLLAGLDSPLGLNDDLRLALMSSVLDAPGRSQGLSVYYRMPYGPWTFALSASQLSYEAPLQRSPQRSSGSSRHQGASVERVLWRGQRGMLSASTRLDRKQLVNRIGKAVIPLQSPTLTTLEAGIELSWLGAGLWHANLGIVQGTGWLGADRPGQHGAAPRTDFRKYRASLLHLRQGATQWPWRWQSELALQYSSDVLPAVEQLLLSDDSNVRGFRQGNYSGASAGAWRNTVSQALATGGPVQIRPYMGLDLGWVRPAQGQPAQRLAGAAAGVEVNVAHNRVRLDYQRALYASDSPHLESGFWVMEWAANF
ncbi:ShlB/FhaC/HecB family hemolysin secretion/activation protein [Pseudomonas sp. NPDC089401]|uniref:ShlB/FhaC/HecB family hemolysin secretion/activation protein n=1 Tax=Pseudomonas sp. NPDC089401 TaxID=3364462 RepID=UPI0037FA2023